MQSVSKQVSKSTSDAQLQCSLFQMSYAKKHGWLFLRQSVESIVVNCMLLKQCVKILCDLGDEARTHVPRFPHGALITTVS